MYMYIHTHTHSSLTHTHTHTLPLITEQATTLAQEEAILEERSARLDYHMDTKHMDPKKAKQAERLGMGGLRARYIECYESENIVHVALIRVHF